MKDRHIRRADIVALRDKAVREFDESLFQDAVWVLKYGRRRSEWMRVEFAIRRQWLKESND